MILNKQRFIYFILIIFSVYCTGIIANDCDVYKGIAGNKSIYKDDLDKMNGNCCRLENRLSCDENNNIIYVRFYIMPCSIESLFEQLANLPKLQEIDITMNDEPIPSTIGKLTQINKLKIRYPRIYNNQYNIPKEIGNLVNLEYLDLSDSNIGGNIPNEIGKLVNLRTLDLNTNHLEGYVPYEFKNLTNLENLDLSGNLLKGFVPPIKNLSYCDIEYNDEMCYLKSSICRAGFNECTLDEIRTINKNNNNPNPNSGEFENEKDIYSESFLKPFIIVVAIGVIVILIIILVIYKKGNRKPKFRKFDNDNHNNDFNSENANNNINNNTSYNTTTANPQPVTYGYNYGSAQALLAPAVSTNPVYYPVPSPVPVAAQPTLYIPPSPATPYNTIPTPQEAQVGYTYVNPTQPPPQHSSYVPPQREAATTEMNNDLPNPLLEEQEHSPNDVLPPYESLNRSAFT